MSAIDLNELAELNRLLDAAMALPHEQHAQFLDSLPDDKASLLPRLRMLLLDWRELSAHSFMREDAASAARDAPTEPIDRIGERIGAYRLIERLGSGGMGEVWLARRDDGIFDREVAVKLPRLADHRDLAERMAMERRIGARLEHPNIARLYDAGVTESGQPWLVMERLHGSDIRTYVQTQPLDARAKVALVAQACDAVAHAHRQLIVHRDIKPSNLWVDETGTVKLLDFGIARQLGPDLVPLERPDARSHTPRWSAPEQRTLAHPISTACDIYALGAVLLDLLTGQAALTPQVESELDPGLRAILRQALATDPADRQASADQLGEDLRGWLANAPPRHAQVGRAWRVRLALRRHRVLAGASALLLLVIAGSAALGWLQWQRERWQAQRTEQVRIFLADVLEDAEPLADGQPVTARTMVERSLTRAESSFAGEPALRGQVLTTLGFVMRRLGASERASELLEQAVALLESDPRAQRDDVQHARAHLAAQLQQSDDVGTLARAATLAQAAVDGCAADASIQCAKATGVAVSVLAAQAAVRGEDQQALAHTEQLVTAMSRAFGPAHVETALALEQLAMRHWALNQYRDADRTLARAEQLLAGQQLRDDDQRRIEFERAELDVEFGRSARAIALLQGLEGRLPAGVGAERIARVRITQMALLGDVQGAQDALDAQPPLAPGWEAVLRDELQARLAARRGDERGARLALARAAAGLDALQVPTPSAWRTRLTRVAAQADVLAGRLDQARARLEGVVGEVDAQGDPMEAARTRDVLGLVLQQQGETARAVALHERALAWWSEALDPAHPMALRSALWLALAREADGQRQDARITTAAQQLAAQRPRIALSSDPGTTGPPRQALRLAWLD